MLRERGNRFRLAALLACVLAAAGGVGTAADPAGADDAPAREVPCEVRTVSVRASEPAAAALACQGAADAIGFLAAQGFDVPESVVIHVVEKLPAAAGTSAAGCYLHAERRVLVLTFAEFARLKTWLNLPADARMYRSLVTHEVAHAVGACNFKVREPSLQAKEYIAYVAMFATMSPAERDLALAQVPGQGFEGDWQMSATIYMLDPVRFGAQAYRHYLKPGNGREFLHAILAGKVLVE
ncbi:MAG TPA: DUF6639 family protein [Burkholderiales bacterium]|nr:DUF6639 family protein [Burkholderiales bacterium]